MSDSETNEPSNAAVENAIRDVVIAIHKAGNDDELTVNHVRSAAEEKLGLGAGFLKQDEWKNASKTLIKEAVVCSLQCPLRECRNSTMPLAPSSMASRRD